MLTIGVIWAIPAIFRYVLLENLRRLADRVDISRRMRDDAYGFADLLVSGIQAGTLGQIFRAHESHTKAALAAKILKRVWEGGLGTGGSGFIDDPQQMRGTCCDHPAHCFEDRMLDARFR